MIASNQTFIIAAYAATWAVLLGYLLRLVRKARRAGAAYDRSAREQRGEREQ